MLQLLDILMATYTVGFSLLSGMLLLDMKAEICAIEAAIYITVCILWPILFIIIGFFLILHMIALSFGAIVEVNKNFW